MLAEQRAQEAERTRAEAAARAAAAAAAAAAASAAETTRLSALPGTGHGHGDGRATGQHWWGHDRGPDRDAAAESQRPRRPEPEREDPPTRTMSLADELFGGDDDETVQLPEPDRDQADRG